MSGSYAQKSGFKCHFMMIILFFLFVGTKSNRKKEIRHCHLFLRVFCIITRYQFTTTARYKAYTTNISKSFHMIAKFIFTTRIYWPSFDQRKVQRNIILVYECGIFFLSKRAVARVSCRMANYQEFQIVGDKCLPGRTRMREENIFRFVVAMKDLLQPQENYSKITSSLFSFRFATVFAMILITYSN